MFSSKIFSAKNGAERGKGVELHGLCAHRYPLASTAFRTVFKCMLIGSEYLTGLICAHIFIFESLIFTLKIFMIEFCCGGSVKSLLVAKLLWGCQLIVHAVHNRESVSSVVLKKIHYSLPCQESNRMNSILSELPRRRNSPTLPYAVPTGNALTSQRSIFTENRLKFSTFIRRREG